MKNLNNIIPNRLSDELYDAIEEMKYTITANGQKIPNGPSSVVWIHLADSVSRGYISPMEAWGTIRLGYVAEHLIVRESKYAHLI